MPQEDLEKTDCQRERQLNRLQKRGQWRRDLAFVCQHPEGQRVLEKILRSLQLGAPILPENVELQNLAHRLLAEIGEVNKDCFHLLCEQLFGPKDG